MKRYIYIEDPDLADKSGNNLVLVFRLIKGDFPRFIGSSDEVHSASAFGVRAEANQIISRVDKHKISADYELVNKNIEVRAL